MMNSRTRSRLWITILVGLVGIVMVSSLILNVVLFGILIEQYRAEQEVRLDPTSIRRFGPKNQALGPKPEGIGRVLLFGDSRIQQWRPLPPVPNHDVVNRGRGDETTAQGLLRLERDVLSLEPDVVVIQYGVNDLKSIGIFLDEADQIEFTCLSNLRRMVGAIHDSGSEVIILTILPVGRPALSRRTTWSDRTIAAIDRVNRELRAITDPDDGVWVIDCDSLFRVGD